MRSLRESTVCSGLFPALGDVRLGGSRGQSSVEYAVVFAGFFALVVAFFIIWQFLADGTVVEHALGAASHHLLGDIEGGMSDVFMY